VLIRQWYKLHSAIGGSRGSLKDMNRIKQIAKSLALLTTCALGVYLFYPFIAYDLIFTSKAESILDDDRIEERIKEIRSDYFRLPQDQWIAIAYKDYHSDRFISHGRSLAIAKCSDGTWLRSQKHYCINIKKTSSHILDRIEVTPEALQDNAQRGLYELTTAKNLEEAVEALKLLGFYES